MTLTCKAFEMAPLDRYAVIGHPIAHSKSPEIHHHFAEQTGQALSYERIEAPLDGFERTVTEFFAQGGKGLNVTVPFKAQAVALATQVTPEARIAGAANTLWMQGDTLVADNTDGVGLVQDIAVNWDVRLREFSVLILGAGGACRGVLLPLIGQGVRAIHIANRTPSKALELIETIKPFSQTTSLSASDLALKCIEPFDLIINATSAGLTGQTPEVPRCGYHPKTHCYDMFYASTPTPFIRWAQDLDLSSRAGYGMLVEQAARSFYVWRSVQPSTAELLPSH